LKLAKLIEEFGYEPAKAVQYQSGVDNSPRVRQPQRRR